MPIKKIKPKSPDPYLGKTKGDTEFARLAHVNYVIDQINNGGGESNLALSINGNTPVTDITISPVLQETYNNGSLSITIDPHPGYNIYRAKIATKQIDWPGYGYLYNWYAVTDARKLENPSGGTGLTNPNQWRVPSDTDWDTLVTFAGGSSVAGGKLKSTINGSPPTYNGWLGTGAGTDDYNFGGLGGGMRTNDGFFSSIGTYGDYWTSSEIFTTNGIFYGFSNFDSTVFYGNNQKAIGFSVRLVREATAGELLLNDGDTSDTSSLNPYTGNDGKTYVTVKIGTQIWLAQNLRETKYNDNSDIFNASIFGGDFTNSTWQVKGTTQEGAWTAYLIFDNQLNTSSTVEYDPVSFSEFLNEVLENTLGLPTGFPSWTMNQSSNGPIYFLNTSARPWSKTHIKVTSGYDANDFPAINERSLLIQSALEGEGLIRFRPIKKDGTTGVVTIEDLNNYKSDGSTSYVYVEIIEYVPASYYNEFQAIGFSNL